VTGPDAYDVRIFTPNAELPFAGHPTLGTAWVLGPGTWKQTSPGATVEVWADEAGARMRQPEPTFSEVEGTAAAQAAAGLSSAEGVWVAEAAGMRHLIVVTEDPIDELRPDLARVAAASTETATTTFAVVRRRDGDNLHVRVFVPSAGIAEDPGTGSAAGPIGLLGHDRLGTSTTVTIHQGAEVGRPSIIEVDVRERTPVVGGSVALCAEGQFVL
jgi:trans-2,3-dihydro-3-hydroxyanthranilate isomerase